MADEKNIVDDETLNQDSKKAKREKKKPEKKKKKDNPGMSVEGEEQEKFSSKLVLALVTVLIAVIWLGIIAILIKSDVGGFGSSVLYPIFKDVPYVNKILPAPESSQIVEETQQSMYGSLDEAEARIKELEQMLDEAKVKEKKDEKKISDLNSQLEELALLKEEQAEFEKLKEKFYEEVVFGDSAPDINEYKTYYEGIDPENAEVLYKQVVEQITYNDKVQDYVKTYMQMKPKEAAAIFNEMTDDLGLVADILMNMGGQARADILGKMDQQTAAKLTKIMEPSK